MGKRKLTALEKVDADLSNLQHRIRRDPLSYEAEFQSQWQQYQNFHHLIAQNPATTSSDVIDSYRELIDFVGHVAQCYPKITTDFASELSGLFVAHCNELSPELGEKLVGTLVLLRNKDVVDSAFLFKTLFPVLISTPRKSLRQLLRIKIVSDIRSANSKSTNHKLNRTLQSVLQNVVADRTSAQGIWAVRIARELWRRRVWTDNRTVEILKEASLHQDTKIALGGVAFFLNSEDEADVESSDEDEIDIRKLKHQMGVAGKSKKKDKQLKAAVAAVKKKERRTPQTTLNFPALHLLNDSQTFAEQLFAIHLSGKSRIQLEQKTLVLRLVTRLVGLHELTIPSLYSYFLKFLTPRQASVTQFLACLAQATHKQVPPEFLEPCVQKIANEFISEAAAAQVAAAGLNAIREICARQPLAISSVLLQDLVQYRKSKDKGVVMAARGLLGLYRQVDPVKLQRKDRGKNATLQLKSGSDNLRFGQIDSGTIAGLDLLQKWKENQGQDDAGGDWEVGENESESSGGWIDVESDKEIDISDSDSDDAEGTKSAADVKPEQLRQADTLDYATTHILTPADIAKLHELQKESAVHSELHKGKQDASWHIDNPVTADSLVQGTKVSQTKAEKALASKAEAETHKSTTAIRKERKREQGKSSTNKDKERKKNIFMTLSRSKQKQKRSLRVQQKILRGHVNRQKKDGRRGNFD